METLTQESIYRRDARVDAVQSQHSWNSESRRCQDTQASRIKNSVQAGEVFEASYFCVKFRLALRLGQHRVVQVDSQTVTNYLAILVNHSVVGVRYKTPARNAVKSPPEEKFECLEFQRHLGFVSVFTVEVQVKLLFVNLDQLLNDTRDLPAVDKRIAISEG